MKISEQNSASTLDAYVRQINNQAPGSPAAESQSRPPHQGDSVALSQNVKDLQAAQEMVNEIPDVRAEKVARLKAQIENGTYEVDAEKIAGKMLKDALLNDMF